MQKLIFWSFSSEIVKFLRSSHPKFSRTEFTCENFSKSRPCFTSGSWKNQKNETVATFYDVCGLFGSKKWSVFTFASRMKVNLCFKAKMEAFRERKSSKVENVPFWLHPTPNFLGRDETRFFAFSIPNLVPNQCFY